MTSGAAGCGDLGLVCPSYWCISAGQRQACPTPSTPPSHFEVRQIPLCSIQAARHPPIDVFPVDLPVIDGGGMQLPQF
jgi:hypothetical protein